MNGQMIFALRSELAREQAYMASQAGQVMLCAPEGPAGFQIIAMLIEAIEMQAAEIASLRQRLESGDVRAG